MLSVLLYCNPTASTQQKSTWANLIVLSSGGGGGGGGHFSVKSNDCGSGTKQPSSRVLSHQPVRLVKK